MHLIYRGVRYELASSNPKVGVPPSTESLIADDFDLPSFQLHYRGSSYASPLEIPISPDSDPELESFIEAFWSIINA